IFCNGDLLYHDIVYWSAEQGDGSYDFNNNFRYVKDWLNQGDLVIGDYEGTITPGRELTGYPMFNAPVEVASAIKNAG
ncbi:CapA family protein, partial [Streptococcus anginosus]